MLPRAVAASLVLITLTASSAFAQRGRGGAGAVAPTGAPSPTATNFKFSFGPGAAPKDYTQVLPDNAYTPGKWGFEGNAKPTGVDDSADGPSDPLTSHFVQGPFTFSTDIAEGNYKVTVHLGDPKGESTTTILAESRRLMVPLVHTDSGKFTTATFIVNVRNSKVPPPPTNAPGGTEVRISNLDNPLTWDNKLTLKFTNTRPCVSAIEIEPITCPTVFIAGDSTVTDQGGDPAASWGQMLPAFFKPDVAFANHATSGETMKSFVNGMRLEKILSQMKKGDYLLMQFGHNDEKQNWPQTYVDPQTTFKAYMGVFIAEARRRGATPVIISPMERRNGANGNTHGGFPQAYVEEAAEQKVAFINDWANSKILYNALGPDVASVFNGTDQTHFQNFGAYELAKLVATGIRANKLELAKSLKDDFQDFDPAHPDTRASFVIPMR